MKVAAVVCDRGAVRQLVAGLIGKLVGPDEISPAHLDTIEVKTARDDLDQAFHGKSRVRASGSSHRRVAGGVGEDDIELHVEGRHRIGAR